jgi:hypothetical protein
LILEWGSVTEAFPTIKAFRTRVNMSPIGSLII